MTSSLLQGRKFYCREWAFSKINHCLENRASAKTCGALVMGGPGCGKSALCCEMVWPTSSFGKQVSLNKRILSYYFCQAHNIETLSITNFIHCLVDQLSKSMLIHGYEDHLNDPSVQSVLDPVQCEANPDEAFKRGVLQPLLSLAPPKHNLYILVDSIDESYLQSISDRMTGSRTIAELLANHHELFPQWLLLICSARKQSKSVTRLFTGFRKISLDDLRKSHVVRDVQQYILSRLDQEEELRQHLSRETAEMLNQLHIKSNGCFLYLEKVLDGVAEAFIKLNEIREIPGTLNGLYLWLCQRLFPKKQFEKIRSILNLILAARRPLTEMELYSCVYTRNTKLEFQEFKKSIDSMSKILIEGKDGTKILFHHSFAEWLLDVKHCTQKYLCAASEGHGMLAMSFTMHAQSLTPIEIQDFALHLVKSNLSTPIEPHHLALWLLQSGADVGSSLMSTMPKDHEVLKLLTDCGAKMPSPTEMVTSLTGSLKLSSTNEAEESIKVVLSAGGSVDQLDETNARTMLHNASFDGNIAAVRILLANKADVLILDKNGHTALNLAARQGHADIVAMLLKVSAANINHTDHDGWTALRSSAWGGHSDVVSLLLEAGAEVDHADGDRRTALRAASWGGHDDIVLKLLEHGAEVNRTDNEGRTALIAASYMGHTDIVSHLLDAGADINHEDIDGRTALSVAALCNPSSEGTTSVVALLVERGAQVDHSDKDGMTPLLVASYEGHYKVCELLLEADADVDHSDHTDRSPLIAAASMGHAEIVELLLFWGAHVDMIDSDGRTVLSIAAQQGSTRVVKLLLDRGLDEMHRDNAGWTPLHMAAFEGHKEVTDLLIAVLLENDFRITETDNEGRIPLLLAAQEGHLGVVTSLVESGAPMEAKSHDGKTSLRIAAIEGHAEVVGYLISQGADVNYMDADGRSTLYVLALENFVKIAELLLQAGGNTEACDLEGRTPLHVAAWQGHIEMAQLLLRYGALVDAVDNDHRTALQSASWQGQAGIVSLLLDNKAKVDHTCNQGATALCIAAQEGHIDVVKVLLQHNANPLHADQFGRTATRVALKGGHSDVVKLLEEYGASPGNNKRSSINSTKTITANAIDPKTSHNHNKNGGNSSSHNANVQPIAPSSHLLRKANAIANGQMHNMSSSPSESPASTGDRQKSAKSSNSNLTSSNTGSTNQSSSSGDINNSHMSFTQQLQQCSKGRNRPISRVLSPVSEPASPQSAHSSPMSEVNTPQTHQATSSPGKSSTGGSFRVISNPSTDIHRYAAFDDEPIWQRQTEINNRNAASSNNRDAKRKGSNELPAMVPGIAMGQKSLSLKSPESRRKRNGIMTNPNVSVTKNVTNASKNVNMNGYFNKLANLPDNVDNFPVSNSSPSSLPNKKPAARPNGLPIKKETPL